jgi:hypothetical protein
MVDSFFYKNVGKFVDCQNYALELKTHALTLILACIYTWTMVLEFIKIIEIFKNVPFPHGASVIFFFMALQPNLGPGFPFEVS